MGPAVLAHIAKTVGLESPLSHPDDLNIGESYVAGQAVASAVSELYRDGLGVVYNDVDMFQMSSGFKRRAGVLSTLDFDITTLGTEYNEISAVQTSVYEVRGSFREGMLNLVQCAPRNGYGAHPDMASHQFLQSFDLNCVQVGVRMSDQKLIWTPAYEQFLASREMLVMNVKTPLHTAVRWFRKKLELEGIYGHDERTMELLIAADHRVREKLLEPRLGRSETKTLQSQTLFGRVYKEKAESVGQSLGQYFRLEQDDSREGVRHDLFTLHATSTPDARLLDAGSISNGVLPLYARAVQGHWKKRVNRRLLDILESSEHSVTRAHTQVFGVAALAVLTSPADEALLNSVFKDHAGLRRLTQGRDTAWQLRFCKEMKALARQEGEWAYGLLETSPGESLMPIGIASMDELSVVLRNVFEERKIAIENLVKAQPALTTRALKKTAIAGFHVRELVSFQDLNEEGARLHHCVAGYFEGVLAGKCRILSMRKHRVADCLTVELHKLGVAWVPVQTRGLVNRIATPEELQAAQDAASVVTLLSACGQLGVPAAWVTPLARKYPHAVRSFYEALAKTGRLARTSKRKLSSFKLSGFGRMRSRSKLQIRIAALLSGLNPRDIVYMRWNTGEGLTSATYGSVGWMPWLQFTKAASTLAIAAIKDALHAEKGDKPHVAAVIGGYGFTDQSPA